MKNVTKRIVDYFPGFKSKLKAYENVLLTTEALEGLDQREAAFLKLAWFFECPEHEVFNIGLLYRHLDNEWLELALELIVDFYKKETFLIQRPSISLVRNNSDKYLPQKQFADFLTENGLDYDRRKLNVYLSRDKIPKPDLEISGTKYWCKETVEKFCYEEKHQKAKK
ncbi:MAG: hypothetical protein ACQEV7_19150 [Bacillota bacterium]